jgi:hypothetical protein
VQRSSHQSFAGWKFDVRIGQIDIEQDIVFTNRRAEQKGPQAADTKLETRKTPRFLVKNTLLTGANVVNVSVTVEYRERIAVQQDQSPAVRERRMGADVELILNFDYIGSMSVVHGFQQSPPSLRCHGQSFAVRCQIRLRRRLTGQTLKHLEIIQTHAARTEALVENLPADLSIQ